jgi:uncharacterized OB-fold protein
MSDRLLPNAVGSNGEFYAWLARGELRMQRCGACGVWRHPPRYLCAACGSAEVSWEPVSGRGKLFSWTVTHRPVDPAFDPPYVVAVVELDEGPRLVTNLVGVELAELRIDLPLAAELAPITDQVTLVQFRNA